jgi:hypothetical protein
MAIFVLVENARPIVLRLMSVKVVTLKIQRIKEYTANLQ